MWISVRVKMGISLIPILNPLIHIQRRAHIHRDSLEITGT